MSGKANEHAYWLVDGDEAKAVLAGIFDDVNAGRRAYAETCRRLGGTGEWLDMRGPSGWIRFDSPPGQAWSERPDYPGFYRPRKNLSAGKAASKELSAAARKTRELPDELAVRLLGTGPILSGHYMLWPGLQPLCGEYVITAALPSASNAEQWKPISGLRRLKDSEYWQMVETSK